VGEAYPYAEARDEQSTGETEPQDACVLTATLDAGDYLVHASAEIRTASGGWVYVRTTVDGDAVTDPVRTSLSDPHYLTYSPTMRKTFTAGSHTVKIQFYVSLGTGYVRNCAIQLIRWNLLPAGYCTHPGDTAQPANTDWFDVATLTFTAGTGPHAIIASLLATSDDDSDYGLDWKLVDSDGDQLQASCGGRQRGHDTVMKTLTLTSGSHTFKVRGKAHDEAGSATAKSIYLMAIRLAASYQYAWSEEPGTGTRATLTWTPPQAHLIFIFDATELDLGTGAPRTRSFNRGATVLSSGGFISGVNYLFSTSAAFYRFTATGGEETFTTSAAASGNTSRILAIDLTLLAEEETYEPLPYISIPRSHPEPQIVAELLPPLDWEKGEPPPAYLPVISGSVYPPGGSSVGYFSVQVEDKNQRIESLMREFDPIMIHVVADNMVKRFMFRVEGWEGNDNPDNYAGRTLEIRGRSWVGAVISKRGRDRDLTIEDREVSDAIINPADGIMPNLCPEVGLTGVKNVGETLEVMYQQRGTNAKLMLDDLRAYASAQEDWAYWGCDGDHLDEEGRPTLHFDRVGKTLSPLEIVVGATMFRAAGEATYDVQNMEIVQYGEYYESTDATALPDLVASRLLDSYTETQEDVSLYSGSVIAAGQAFTPPRDCILGTLAFYLKKTGSPTGDITAKLYRATGTVGEDAEPTGDPIAVSIAKSAANLTTSYAKIQFPLISPPIISYGESYAVTVHFEGGNADNTVDTPRDIIASYPFPYEFPIDFTLLEVPSHGGNYCSLTGDDWTPDGDADLVFWIYESPNRIGLAPEYTFKRALGEPQAQAMAEVLVRGKSEAGFYHTYRLPFSLEVWPNSKILILNPQSSLVSISRVTQPAYTIYYDDDGYKHAYIEATLAGSSTGL